MTGGIGWVIGRRESCVEETCLESSLSPAHVERRINDHREAGGRLPWHGCRLLCEGGVGIHSNANHLTRFFVQNERAVKMGRGFIPLLMPVPVKTRGLETRPPEHLITGEEGQVHTVPPRRLHIPALPPAPIFVVTHRHVELVFGPCRVGLGRESVWGGGLCVRKCPTAARYIQTHTYTTIPLPSLLWRNIYIHIVTHKHTKL